MDEVNHEEDGSKDVVPAVVYSNQDLTPRSTAIPPSGPEGSITWSASEFIAHQKGLFWYVWVILAAVIVAAIIWILTKDKITAGVILVVGVVMVIFGSKQPKEQQYKIDSSGLSIGEKHHPFVNFRSFALVKQGAFSSLVFMPLKRFGFLTTAYYDPQDEQKIISLISAYLPLEERRKDILDDLMWKIRF